MQNVRKRVWIAGMLLIVCAAVLAVMFLGGMDGTPSNLQPIVNGLLSIDTQAVSTFASDVETMTGTDKETTSDKEGDAKDENKKESDSSTEHSSSGSSVSHSTAGKGSSSTASSGSSTNKRPSTSESKPSTSKPSSGGGNGSSSSGSGQNQSASSVDSDVFYDKNGNLINPLDNNGSPGYVEILYPGHTAWERESTVIHSKDTRLFNSEDEAAAVAEEELMDKLLTGGGYALDHMYSYDHGCVMWYIIWKA